MRTTNIELHRTEDGDTFADWGFQDGYIQDDLYWANMEKEPVDFFPK